MFEFLKWNRIANDAYKYCIISLSGLNINSNKLPLQIIGDAYVAGFMQQLIMLAVLEGGKSSDPRAMLFVAERTYDRFEKGLGARMIRSLSEVNNPGHPAHENYKVGQREGKEYVTSLINGEQEKCNEILFGFRAFIKRNYMDIK